MGAGCLWCCYDVFCRAEKMVGMVYRTVDRGTMDLVFYCHSAVWIHRGCTRIHDGIFQKYSQVEEGTP